MVLLAIITDHYHIICCINDFRFTNLQKQNKQQTFFRNKSKFYRNEFSNGLISTSNNFMGYSSTLSPDNFNETFNQFSNIVLSFINQHAPLKSLSHKHRRRFWRANRQRPLGSNTKGGKICLTPWFSGK